jgi:hypothetical protein
MSDINHHQLTEEARTIIRSSHIPEADKQILEGRVAFVALPVLSMFVELCKEDPFSTESIVKSLKQKLDAQGNLRRIHEIVKQERMEIEQSFALG